MSEEKYRIVENILGDGIGRIELLDWIGGDLRTVNAARASYGRESDSVGAKEEKLVGYLADHSHMLPFRHTVFTLRVKAPEFVARQWYKHVVGSQYHFNDMPWSEFSQRFLEVAPEIHVPPVWYEQGEKNKQGSGKALSMDYGTKGEAASDDTRDLYRHAMQVYRRHLDRGIVREQARIVLPLGIYTEWVWTASLQCVQHFCALRDHAGAQREIVVYAKVLADLCRPAAPLSWDGMMKNHPITLQERIEALEAGEDHDGE